MDVARWKIIEALVEEVMEMSAEERQRILKQRCCDDPQLLLEVNALLMAMSESDDFLEKPVLNCIEPTDPQEESEAPDDLCHLENLIILGPLGTGGMGQVFLAQQTNVQRRVALKVVRSRWFDKDLDQRFISEYQILARMHHKNIAAIYDAGFTSGDRPYFTMEYVAGRALNEFLEEFKPDLKLRIDIFCQVCEGLQHAHQKGVIHRDIKPSNILVAGTGKLDVRIIDFGIARQLEQASNHTNQGQLMGTLAYMSPEQLDGAEVDTRTDIYGLGALLYELLTGMPPVDSQALKSLSHSQKLKFLLDHNPKRPSLCNGPFQSQNLADELDWITLKALARQPADRYPTVAAMAEDLVAWREDRPVSARPHGAWYLAGKYFRTHRTPALAAAAVFLALALGLVAALYGMDKAEKGRQDAELARFQAEERRLETESAFKLMERTLFAPSPWRQGKEVRVLDQVERLATDEDLSVYTPGVRAIALMTTAKAFQNLGMLQAALTTATRAWEENRSYFGDYHKRTLDALELMAFLEVDLDHPLEAADKYQQIIEAECPGPGLLQAQRGRANLQARSGELDQARENYLAIMNQLLGQDDFDPLFLAQTMRGLAIVYRKLGDFTRAETLLNWTLEPDISTRLPMVEIFLSLNVLANIYMEEPSLPSESRSQLGLDIYREIWLGCEPFLPENHKDRLMYLSNYGRGLRKMQHFEEALKICTQAVQGRIQLFGIAHVDTDLSITEQALCLKSLGRFDEALSLLKQLNQEWTKAEGPLSSNAHKAANNILDTLLAAGRYEETLSNAREYLTLWGKDATENDLDQVITQAHLAMALSFMNQCEEALPILKKCYQDLPDEQARATLQTSINRCLEE